MKLTVSTDAPERTIIIRIHVFFKVFPACDFKSFRLSSHSRRTVDGFSHPLPDQSHRRLHARRAFYAFKCEEHRMWAMEIRKPTANKYTVRLVKFDVEDYGGTRSFCQSRRSLKMREQLLAGNPPRERKVRGNLVSARGSAPSPSSSSRSIFGARVHFIAPGDPFRVARVP